MVDSVRLTRLLARMTDTVSELRAMIEDERSRQWLLAVKYLFVVAIEASTDVAQHVCASEGWGPPRTNADAMRVLGRHGAIDESLGDQLARAVGFRNVLVHQYAEVDDDRVIAMLDRLGDLDAFAAAIASRLSS